MIPDYVIPSRLDEVIRQALAEDIGEGDHSTLAAIPEEAEGKAILIAREQGVIAGLELANSLFQSYDPDLVLDLFIRDGDPVAPGQEIFMVSGRIRSILSTERLMLNFLQRMSGIATRTRALADRVARTGARLLDTRKTTPGLRMLEKWAVKIGGAENHRHGLYDMIMLKDNHIDAAGGIRKALEAAREYLEREQISLKIEVETRNLKEVREVLEAGGCDMIMLDNMQPSEMKQAVSLINGRIPTEASGNITEENILEVAEAGVDFISIGALTHSVKSLDLSLKIKP